MNLTYICVFITLLALTSDAFDFKGTCGESKSCILWTKCELKNCDLGVSWKTVLINNKKYLEIELVGKVKQSQNQFVAIGFSVDNKMSDDGVIGCYMYNGEFKPAVGYNPSFYNEFIKKDLLDSDLGVDFTQTVVSYDSSSGHMRCRLFRKITPTKEINKLKDLANSEYYLLGAVGPMKDSIHFSRHYSTWVSAESVNFTKSSFNTSIGESTPSIPIFIKLHACMAICGWILLLTNGIIIASVYRNSWKSDKVKVALWFNIHRGLQVAGMIIVILAIIFILVQTKGVYSSFSEFPNSAHPILGIISTILLILNPIISLMRCSPDHPKRPIFNWVHLSIGIVGCVFALVTLTIGMQLPPMLAAQTYPWCIAGVFLILFIIIYIWGKVLYYRNNKNGISASQTEHTDANIKIRMSNVSPSVIIVSAIASLIFGLTLIIIIGIN